MAMAERILFDVIQEGLEFFKDNPKRFTLFLRDPNIGMGLSEEEAEQVTLYFTGGVNHQGETVEARPPTLVHGYARTGGPFPCWALTLGAETISDDWLGRDVSDLDYDGERYRDPITDEVIDAKARRLQYRFDIMVHADHPDICVYYYQLLKNIVMTSQSALEDRNVEGLIFSGADLAPDARYLPSSIFTRMLQITVQGDECWGESLGIIGSSVGGIHVDGGEGETGGVGSVSAGVTSYFDNDME